MNAIDMLFGNATLLPQIPKVVQELIDSLKDEDVDLAQLASKVKQDQVISAKVLRLANSSYYGSKGKVGSIDEAITLIGLNAFRTLIIASGVAGAFKQVPGLDLAAFWKNSMLVANIAKALARSNKLDAEAAFTIGLMHGIGQLMLHLGFPDGAAKVAANCKGTSVGERKAVERTLLQIDHCQVGAELAKRWHFPAEIQDSILHYADPINGNLHAKVVHTAVLVAQELAAGQSSEQIFSIVPENCRDALHLELAWFTDREDAFAALLADTASLV